MKISVIVTVYNLERFVASSINSVLNQTRKPDEVIVMDDCSTDGSAAVIQTYGNKVQYKKMAVNSGAMLTSLQGVKMATGDVCCMIDGDDTWARNKLEEVEKFFSRHSNAILLSHHHIRVNENEEPLNITDDTHDNIERITKKAKNENELHELIVDTLLSQKGYWMGSAYSFKRSAFNIPLFEAQIASFPNKKDTYLDTALCPFLVLTSKGLTGYTPDTYFNYRIHGNNSQSVSKTIASAKKSVAKGKNISEFILHICRCNNCPEKYIKIRLRGLKYFDFLYHLYSKKYFSALKCYFQLVCCFLDYKSVIKETKRLFAVIIMGPEKFIKLK